MQASTAAAAHAFSSDWQSEEHPPNPPNPTSPLPLTCTGNLPFDWGDFCWDPLSIARFHTARPQCNAYAT